MFCPLLSHGMSYPISGLVKSYKAKDYEVDHPLVVSKKNLFCCEHNTQFRYLATQPQNYIFKAFIIR